MKNSFFIILIFAALSDNHDNPGIYSSQGVNPVLGDLSFYTRFGSNPTQATNEILRIKTHLSFVEEVLRGKDVTGLSFEQQQNRSYLLDQLHAYWQKSIFPRNTDHPGQRKPCFIDDEGRICAVGFLIEQSAGRGVAEEINREYRYEEIFSMRNQTIENWIANSGLTKLECAMIQPAYEGPPVTTGYGVSSAILGAANVSFITLNSIQLIKGNQNKTIPHIGLATGAAEVILGLVSMPRYSALAENNDKRTLSWVNIGVGSTTMILSVINLLSNRNSVREKKTKMGIYSFPAGKKTGLGITMTKTL